MNHPVVLVLGGEQDRHATHMQAALTQANCVSHLVDTALFPGQICISLVPDEATGSVVLPTGDRLAFEQIRSVYWRTLSRLEIPQLDDPEQQRIAANDAMSTLRSLMQACPARWVNSWQAYQFHKEKPLQLQRASQLGVKIPKTLITNDVEQVIEFTHRHASVIFKPVCGGVYTKLITSKHLERSRLTQALRYAPITLQEYVPGTNIRSYVVGGSVFSAEIRSESIDFRTDRQASLIPLEVPEAIAQQSVEITHAFGMEWTAIDWRRTPDGTYVFLEANFSPMFLHFEQQTQFPITDALVDLLKQDSSTKG
jgi:glutathione synthase/RimK-type ligase-like ATP-grasp enzyme